MSVKAASFYYGHYSWSQLSVQSDHLTKQKLVLWQQLMTGFTVFWRLVSCPRQHSRHEPFSCTTSLGLSSPNFCCSVSWSLTGRMTKWANYIAITIVVAQYLSTVNKLLLKFLIYTSIKPAQWNLLNIKGGLSTHSIKNILTKVAHFVL